MSFNIIRLNRLLFSNIGVNRVLGAICTSSLLLQEEISLNNIKIQKYLENLRKEYYDIRTGLSAGEHNIKRLKSLSSIVNLIEQRDCLLKNIESLGEIQNEKDEDMKKLIEEENQVYSGMLQKVDKSLLSELYSFCDQNECSSVFFEINAGVGGQEAMLFAKELLEMYCNFLDYKQWEYEIVNCDHTDIGGLRHATLIVYGDDAFKVLRQEAGVHRVQRVPETEKSGRVHTSTVSVAIIPRPDDVNIEINDKDLKIETKRASGAGGQHVNTTDSAVRLTHIPTGIVVECQTDRSQVKNREIAMKKLQSKLLQLHIETQEANMSATKKAQTGSNYRNEKIRTYNFLQDRITDHRIKGGTMHNLQNFLEGGEMLDRLIRQLETQRQSEIIAALILKEN